MEQYDDFEKQHDFETKRLVDYVYKSLSDGNSVLAVKKDLIFKGIAEQEADYVVNYIYQKKRWQIAWRRAGEGAKLVTAGLGSIFASLIIVSVGFFIMRVFSVVYTQASGWIGNGLMVVGAIVFATGIITSLWGAFRLMTASEDSMRGCLTAAIIAFVLFVLGVLGYLLVRLL
ncbi:MAG: hypothetical protein R3E31_22850 [Chloroflexota bacterium]